MHDEMATWPRKAATSYTVIPVGYMKDTPTPFTCLRCHRAQLNLRLTGLTCPACGANYPVSGKAPILLPSDQQFAEVRTPESSRFTLAELQTIYDRAYTHDGLMGTDLDKGYDRTTKEQLLTFAGLSAGQRLLDVGAGVGNLWDYVPKGIEGFALDLSLVGVSKALTRHPGLTASVSIAEYLPYPDGYFDAVIAADTLEHTFSPERALAEVHRVLRAGGVLAASFPIPNSLRKWGWNELVQQRPNLRFLFRLGRVLIKRILLFRRLDFQPLDRDHPLEHWVEMLSHAGFTVDTTLAWPTAPKLPIVNLVRAVRA